MWTASIWHVAISMRFPLTCKHKWRFNLNLTTYPVLWLTNNRGGPAPKPSAADMWSSPPKRITPLSSTAIMDGGWLPLRPSLCTAEHCEPHEIKLLLKRRITLLGPTLFPSPFPSLISYSYWSHLHSPLGMGFKMFQSRNECWINRFKH